VFYKESLGIFLGEHTLEYFLLKKRLNKWQQGKLSIYSEPTGKSCFEKLNSLLSQIKPKRSRRVCVLIPKTRYYLRELKFPGLTLEEAENAVRISIGVHAHLSPEEIVYDCYPFKREGISHVILCYSKKSFIEAIIEQFQNTGHIKNLYCICPVGLGADLLLRFNKEITFPILSAHKEESDIIINFHGKSCWQGSHSINSIKNLTPAQFNKISDIALFAGLEASPLPNKRVIDPYKGLNIEIFRKDTVDLGVLASIVGTSSYPLISLKPGLRKKPLVLRVDAYQLAFIGLLLFIFLFTAKSFLTLGKLGIEYKKNEQIISKLNKVYKPLKLKEEELKKIQSLKKDLNDFIHERPSLLDILKEIAEKTPKNAWVKSLSVRGSKIRISAEGGYAVETMEAWRKSKLFTEIKLVSPVTKNSDGQERYTVEFKIK